MATTSTNPILIGVEPDGTVTPVWVERNLPIVSEERRWYMAAAITGWFGRGLFERAERRRLLRSQARIERGKALLKELRDAGLTPAEGRKIMLTEGYHV